MKNHDEENFLNDFFFTATLKNISKNSNHPSNYIQK